MFMPQNMYLAQKRKIVQAMLDNTFMYVIIFLISIKLAFSYRKSLGICFSGSSCAGQMYDITVGSVLLIILYKKNPERKHVCLSN